MARVRISRPRRYGRRRIYGPMRKKFGARNYHYARIVKGATLPNYSYKQKVYTQNWLQTSPTNETYQGLVFSLGQIGGNLAPFTALYDQYAIKLVKVQVVPKSNSFDGTTSGSIMPRVISAIDYDSIPVTDSISNIMQYQNVKLTPGDITHKRVLKPRFLNVIDSTVVGLQTNTGYIDVANASVDHLGLKVIVPPTPGQVITYDLIVTYYLKFKNVR